jgi:hypothetical protein
MGSPAFVLTDSQKVPYQIIGDDAAGFPGAALPAGATIAVTSSDPTIAVVVPDAAPAPGTVASGFIAAAVPAKVSVAPIQINAAVTNADGTPGPTGSLAVSVVAGALATIVMSLGAAVAK